MAQYIDKSAIEKEIERRISLFKKEKKTEKVLRAVWRPEKIIHHLRQFYMFSLRRFLSALAAAAALFTLAAVSGCGDQAKPESVDIARRLIDLEQTLARDVSPYL